MAQKSPKTLRKWSWPMIISVYRTLGENAQEMNRIQKTFNIPDTIDTSYPDLLNIFILRFNRDADRLEEAFNRLDAEIDRRNRLIGVVG